MTRLAAALRWPGEGPSERSRGAGQSPDRRPAHTSEQAPSAFHLLAKPTGAQCNLDCDYCFFLSKELLYPDSRFRMSDEQLDAYLRQLIEAHAAAPGGHRSPGRAASPR